MTVYYLPGTTGWHSPIFDGAQAVLWNPAIPDGGIGFGIQSDQFGFNITGNSNIPVLVEASPNLAAPVWTPLQTVTLTNGLFHFSEPLQSNTASYFYRLVIP